MSAYDLININKLIEEDGIFWTDIRVDLFDILLDYNPTNKPWTRKNVAEVIKKTYKQLKLYKVYAIVKRIKFSRKFVTREISQLLHYGEQHGIFILETRLQTFTKKHRTTLLSNRKKDIKYFSIIRLLLDAIWSTYITKGCTTDELLLPFACSLMADSGFGKPNMPSMLHRIRICDITTSESIVFPISNKDTSDFCSEIPLVNSARLLIAKIISNRYNELSTNYLFFPKVKKSRSEIITDNLEKQYNVLLSKLDIKHNTAPSLNTFFRLLPQIGLHRGIPLHIVSLLSNSTLPVTGFSHQYFSFFRQKPIINSNTLFNQIKKLSLTQKNTQIKRHIDISYASPKDDTWKNKADKILKQFRQKLFDLNIDNLKNPSKRQDILDIQDKFIKKASFFSDRDSVLHLAIEWTVDKILNGKVKKVSTIKTYHSQMFTAGLFHFNHAQNLSKSDSDSHENFINDNIALRNLSGNTSKDYSSRLLSLYKYAFEMGYINNVDLNILTKAFAESKRSIVLWPSQYDKVIEGWRNNNQYIFDLLAIAADLSYYAGLREGEILNLNVGDILFKGKVCEIIIRKGKSNYARRIIPFYILAPEKTILELKKIWEIRKEIAKSDLYTPLFGSDEDSSIYEKDSFLNTLNHGLKYAFGTYFSPHLLRHCFANNTISRIYSLINPKLTSLLPDQEHEIYSKKYHRYLSEWLTNKSDINKLGNDHTLLWQSAKLLGHSTPAEGLFTYCHIFPYIFKSHISEMNDTIDEHYKLTRRAASFLLPNMSSSKTRANKFNPKMTISEAAEIAWQIFR